MNGLGSITPPVGSNFDERIEKFIETSEDVIETSKKIIEANEKVVEASEEDKYKCFQKRTVRYEFYEKKINNEPLTPHPFPLKKVLQDTFTIMTLGPLAGYVFYWINPLLQKLNLLTVVGKVPTRAFTFVLTAAKVASVFAFANFLRLAYPAFLGNRSDFSQDKCPTNFSILNKLRYYNWQVIFFLEGILHKIDALFSKLLGIDTVRQIESQRLSNGQILKKPYSQFTPLEIWREAIYKEVGDFVTGSIGEQGLKYFQASLGFLPLVLGLKVRGAYLIIRIFERAQKMREQAQEESKEDKLYAGLGLLESTREKLLQEDKEEQAKKANSILSLLIKC